ncbi:MAG: aminotransferase [Bacteroidaceae bacterium]|nr:aminotransferase [Bacteroidaceae bacterium]
MKNENKEKNVYVQPVCKSIQMGSAQLVCTSDITPQSDDPEDIGYGGKF